MNLEKAGDEDGVYVDKKLRDVARNLLQCLGLGGRDPLTGVSRKEGGMSRKDAGVY